MAFNSSPARASYSRAAASSDDSDARRLRVCRLGGLIVASIA